jgi:hypothetical protein
METPEKSLDVQSPDLTLNENSQAAEVETQQNQQVAATETVDSSDAMPAEESAKPTYESAAEVVEALKTLADKDAEAITRDEVSRLKHLFYAFQKTEVEPAETTPAEQEQPQEQPQATAEVDPLEEQLKSLLEAIKEKKAQYLAQVEATQLKNYEAKEALITELEAMAADTDNVNRAFPRYREIQQQFKAIGDVPPQQMSDQWKKYQEAVEHFYDQLKVNKDLRDYDFKKNLDTKLHLCDEAEKLADESDIIVAFKRLQDLHIKWRETGPVAKETREEIWNRFKDASAVVNKKYQAFFEERKQREQQNEQAKTAICERVEALDIDSYKSFNAWNAATKTILEAQEDWKKLGFASKKTNNALFARFRAVCDKFFEAKALYYRSVKDELSINLEKKISLCEQAEALKDSTAWKATAEKLTDLQKQWKAIGAVPKKQSDAVWARFQAACDYFFEQKKKDLSESRHAEQANLKAKKAITAALAQTPDDATREEAIAAIKEAQAKWNEVGHVPFREKDKVFEEFRATINAIYKKHDVRESRSNMARFESSINEISDENKLYRERERLARILESKRNELTTYQNNLGFFNIKSASGSSMLRDIERRQQRIKDDIADIENKIKLIDERL